MNRWRVHLLALALVLFVTGAFALDVDLGTDFPELGFARGDKLNFKFDKIREAFLLNFPIASEPERLSFLVTTATTTFEWPAASFSYDINDNRLHVFINGIYQDPTSDFTMTSSTTIVFDSALLPGWKVLLWRW
jgi:hypothetical protein